MSAVHFNCEPPAGPRLFVWFASLAVAIVLFVMAMIWLTDIHTTKIRPVTMPQTGAPGAGRVVRNLVVDVLGDGTVRVMGRTLRSEELTGLLAAEHLPQVKILCASNVPYMYVQDVMDRCRQAGIYTVSFGTSPKADRSQPVEEG